MIQTRLSSLFFHPPRTVLSFKRFDANYLLALLLIDLTLIQGAFWLSVALRFWLPVGRELANMGQLALALPALHLFVGAIWLFSFLIADVYHARSIVRWPQEFQRLLLAHTVASFCLAGLLYLANIELMRLIYLYFYTLTLVTLLGYRVLIRLWHRLHGDTITEHNVLLIGTAERLKALLATLPKDEWQSYRIVGLIYDQAENNQTSLLGIPVLGSLSSVNLTAQLQQHAVDDVVLALPRQLQGSLYNLLETLHNLPVNLRVIPDYFDLTFRRATISQLGYIPVIDLHNSPLDTFQRVIKRLLDIIGALLILSCSWPVMALVALAIKLEDGGPIFYFAQRVGEKGQIFTMYKFRSMVLNADQLQEQLNQQDEAGNLIHKFKNDPRVTRVGRFIRRTSLDELPQFCNVLKGDMSLVGPRPELPWLVEQYEQWQYRRLSVPQGITGWWQVNGRSNHMMHLNTEQDIYYVENYSLWLDLRILWRTVSVVLENRGAY